MHAIQDDDASIASSVLGKRPNDLSSPVEVERDNSNNIEVHAHKRSRTGGRSDKSYACNVCDKKFTCSGPGMFNLGPVRPILDRFWTDAEAGMS